MQLTGPKSKAVHSGNQFNDNECLIQKPPGRQFIYSLSTYCHSMKHFLEQGRHETKVPGLVAANCKVYLVLI